MGVRRLAGAAELLDGPLEPWILAGNLRDLARMNRFLGGSALSWRALEPILRRRALTGYGCRMLDVGTGAADIPRELLRRAGAADYRLSVVANDIRPEIVDYARRASRDISELDVVVGPPQGIEADDQSFDVVHSSLMLHHCEPATAVSLLREMRRVSAGAVIVNDLARGRIWWTAAWLLSRIATRNRYSRHDAPLSVRRAYSPDEISALGAAAGLREVRRYRHVLGYRYAIAFARSPAADE